MAVANSNYEFVYAGMIISFSTHCWLNKHNTYTIPNRQRIFRTISICFSQDQYLSSLKNKKRFHAKKKVI